ncbi:MAG: c-type cytochrome [Pseudomonadota bacterium]
MIEHAIATTAHGRRRPGLVVLALACALAAGCGDGATGGQGPDAQNGPQGAQPVPGTFRPDAPIDAPEQSRLPGEGDLAIYVPATTLFPGTAYVDPGIENPLADDPEAVSAGERHYAAYNCGGCHAPLGGGGMGPPLSDDAWIYGSDPAQVYLSIMHGRPQGMPAWASMLPARTAWELVAYIETLDDIDDYATELGFDTDVAAASRNDAAPEAASDSP